MQTLPLISTPGLQLTEQIRIRYLFYIKDKKQIVRILKAFSFQTNLHEINI